MYCQLMCHHSTSEYVYMDESEEFDLEFLDKGQSYT